MLRNWHLQDKPIHALIGVEQLNLTQQIGLGNILAKFLQLISDADLLAGLGLHLGIHTSAGVIADHHRYQAWRPRHLFDFRHDFGLDLFSNRSTFKYLSTQFCIPPCSGSVRQASCLSNLSRIVVGGAPLPRLPTRQLHVMVGARVPLPQIISYCVLRQDSFLGLLYSFFSRLSGLGRQLAEAVVLLRVVIFIFD